MVYDHMVKYNGVYYPTGADVPMGDKPVVEKKIEAKVETVTTNATIKEEIASINNVMKLRKIAKENGVTVPSTASLAEIKDLIYSALDM